jgi:hypothetical protein
VLAENGTSMPAWRAWSISCLEQEVRALAAFGADDGRQRVQPFAGFLGIGVVGGGPEELFRHGGHWLSPGDEFCKRGESLTARKNFQMVHTISYCGLFYDPIGQRDGVPSVHEGCQG